MAKQEFKADKIQGAAVALVSYFIFMPTIHTAVRDSGEVVEDAIFAGLDFDYIGPNGIFMALICVNLEYGYLPSLIKGMDN